MRAGVVPSRANSADQHWALWHTYCNSLGLHPTHPTLLSNPVPLLQVFATRYRDGRLAPSGRLVRHRTVEDVLRSVGQAYARLGAQDPRLNVGQIDSRIQRQLRAYQRVDPPPVRVKPIPIALVHQVLVASNSPRSSSEFRCIADMIVIAFFFLLRPGEYTGTTGDNCPFRLRDIQLFLGHRRLTLLTATVEELAAATHVSYTFTKQKNGVPGEVIHHGRSGATWACPVQATIRRVIHLREHNAPLATPIASFFQTNRFYPVRSSAVTGALRTACLVLGSSLGILPSDISARSLRAGGAMALFCAKIDTDTIRLLGRWRSDEMMRYLHLQAQPIMRDFARLMLAGGSYSFIPGQTTPCP
jgi:hypothetical protein